jgi:hypothetical protein
MYIIIQGHEIYALLNNATSGQPFKVLPATISRVAKNLISDKGGLIMQKMTTISPGVTTTQMQNSLAMESSSPSRMPISHPDASTLTSNGYGDPQLLREVLSYLQAILNPPTPDFPASHVLFQPTPATTISN